jgi:hypothetical protein
LTRWSPRERRARIVAAAAAWFNPERWSQYDLVIAVSALVLVVSSFMPWYKATVRSRFEPVNGFLMQPRGTVSGLAVHAYLWVAFALAVLEFVVLAARYAPGRHAFALPGYRWMLAVTSGLIFIAVLMAFVAKPSPWYGHIEIGGALYVVVGWTYGAVAALAAAVVSLGIAVSALRDHRAR